MGTLESCSSVAGVPGCPGVPGGPDWTGVPGRAETPGVCGVPGKWGVLGGDVRLVAVSDQTSSNRKNNVVYHWKK